MERSLCLDRTESARDGMRYSRYSRYSTFLSLALFTIIFSISILQEEGRKRSMGRSLSLRLCSSEDQLIVKQQQESFEQMKQIELEVRVMEVKNAHDMELQRVTQQYEALLRELRSEGAQQAESQRAAREQFAEQLERSERIRSELEQSAREQ